MSEQIAIKIQGLKKQYRLGQIGGGTLTADLQSWWARVRHKEDPNSKIGTDQRLIGQTFMALNGIDLTIKKGEAIGIIGGNGAGKSTMLKILSRITAPTEGCVDIYGRIASMLEVGTGFSPEMTGRENVYMNGAILGMTKAEIDAKMEDIIEFSEVRDFIDTPVKRYSSGMYVKLAFSVAAHLDSEIMIMDEVLAVGDMAFQKKCLDKMRDAATVQGKTVLYVSHNMNTIRQLCDRCVVLDKGRIIFDGDVERAIEMYLGLSTNSRNHYDYTKEYHLYKPYRENLLIQSLDIDVDEDKMSFAAGEKIPMRLVCKTKAPEQQVRFRFEVQFRDGSAITAMMSDRAVDFGAEETKEIEFVLSTEHFTPGCYRIDIVAYIHDAVGNEEVLDGVYPGFQIEINETMTGNDHLKWQHSYWGHLHLQDAQLCGQRTLVE